MQLVGKIRRVDAIKQVSERFSTRNFVLTKDWDKEYPQQIEFQLQNQACDIIDAYKPDQTVIVDFNINGREWTNTEGDVKIFNTLQVWKIQPFR